MKHLFYTLILFVALTPTSSKAMSIENLFDKLCAFIENLNSQPENVNRTEIRTAVDILTSDRPLTIKSIEAYNENLKKLAASDLIDEEDRTWLKKKINELTDAIEEYYKE